MIGKISCFLLFTFGLAGLLPVFAQVSPDGKVRVETVGETMKVTYGSDGGRQTIWSAPMPGIRKTGERQLTDSYDMILGKQHHISRKAMENSYSLPDGGILYVRAYNNGVAFRKCGRVSVASKTEEAVVMDFSAAKNNWLQKWADSYEGFFPLNRDTKNGERLGFPALFEYNDGVFALLSEAGLEADNAAASMYCTDTKGVFRIQPDANDMKAQESAWRTVIIGSLGDIVESTLITDVCPDSRIADMSWIKPGVASWVYWAYNHGSNDYSIIKKYVDMAVALKLPYVLIDAEWDEMPKLASNEGKTIEDAVRYANENGVKPIIWYNSSVGWINGAPTPKFRLNKPEDREKEFAWCEKIGVKGVKIDFFSGDNNMNIKYMIDLLESAANHHLLVNFHGATVPRGWQRTYPNLVSTEGVYGAEWYNNVPTFTDKAARHNATLPFTRNVIGSMDYTPCAFTDSQHPHITTHAHELALTALYESGIQHLADRPESFLAQPVQVRKYLGELPTAWDETRYVSGYPGESAVLARRKGGVWYVAGINGRDEAQTLDISSLGKLGIKVSEATWFEDGKNVKSPWKIRTVKAVDFSKGVACKARGGFLLVIK